MDSKIGNLYLTITETSLANLEEEEVAKWKKLLRQKLLELSTGICTFCGKVGPTVLHNWFDREGHFQEALACYSCNAQLNGGCGLVKVTGEDLPPLEIQRTYIRFKKQRTLYMLLKDCDNPLFTQLEGYLNRSLTSEEKKVLAE